jgi:hypothetical protein
MNKEFIEVKKVKWEIIKIKYEALTTRDNYYFNLVKKIGIIVTWLSLISC